MDSSPCRFVDNSPSPHFGDQGCTIPRLVHPITAFTPWPCCCCRPHQQSYSPTLPKYPLLAIGIRGIFILKLEDKTTLERHMLSDIYRWGFTPAVNFYFELKAPTGGGGMRFTFNTLQVQALCSQSCITTRIQPLVGLVVACVIVVMG